LFNLGELDVGTVAEAVFDKIPGVTNHVLTFCFFNEESTLLSACLNMGHKIM
jgi:hypothetical protein